MIAPSWRALLAGVLIVVMAQLCARPGLAQPPPILTMEPSVRASGMGHASAAVFWGGDPSDLTNPALLGYHQGVRLNLGKKPLLPGPANHAFLKTDRMTVGMWGVGVSLVGRPFPGLGRAKLDYGESMALREDGTELGTFRSHENLYSFGAGVSLIEFAESTVSPRLRTRHPISRYGDVSLGFATKKADFFWVPAWASIDRRDVAGSVKTEDIGLLIRLTPINTMDRPGISVVGSGLGNAMQPLGGLRLDLAYGRSTQNLGRQRIDLAHDGQLDPITRLGKHGWSAWGATGLPPSVQATLKDRGLGLVAEGLAPLIQVGVAGDRSHVEWPARNEPDILNLGGELTVANIFTLRRGHTWVQGGENVDDTWGWGLGFQVGQLGGFRYDHADVHQPGAGHLKPTGFTIFVRPLEFIAAM